MSKGAKIWLITGACLVLVGCILFGGVMAMLKWDFKKLSTSKYETSKYEINDGFSAIAVDIDTADITFVASENETCTVECYERTNEKHTVAVKDGALVIELVDSRKWYEHIGINFGSPKITVALPETVYSSLIIKGSTGDIALPKDFKFESIALSVSTGDIDCSASATERIQISASTGDICVENVSAAALDLSVSTGRVTVTDVTCAGDVTVKVSTGKVFLTDVACKSVISDGNTGDITLKNVKATEKFTIERSTGDVHFDGCDAAELLVKTDTGDVKGSLLTEKVFVTKTDTGRINVPATTSGGRCQITTDTGNIKITIAQ